MEPEAFWEFDKMAWQESPFAKGSGAVRKYLAQGEGGLWVVHVKQPPGFIAKPHSHDEDEILFVLEGGCEIMDGPALKENDAVLLKAGREYGFRTGSKGMRFLTIRKGSADPVFNASKEAGRPRTTGP